MFLDKGGSDEHQRGKSRTRENNVTKNSEYITIEKDFMCARLRAFRKAIHQRWKEN